MAGKAVAPLRRQLVRQDSQSMVMRPDIPRSRFRNRYNIKTGFNAGVIYPLQAIEIYPGDDMSFSVSGLLRMATLIRPQFDGQQLDIHAFFVPNRLVWDNWEAFMGQVDASDSGSPTPGTIPQLESAVGGFVAQSLMDYYGMVTTAMTDNAAVESISALVSRGYNKIYNEHYRDQNLIDEAVVDTDDGPDSITDYVLRRRAYAHDRFTSLLPWAQKFDAVTIPIGGAAWVRGIGVSGPATGGAVIVTESPGVPGNYGASYLANTDAVFINSISGNPQIYADLSSVAGIDVNVLRDALAIQSLHELDARGGTRYIELNKMHFGVTSPDARMQRTEYIGGGSVPIQLTPIADTSTTTLGAIGAAGAAAVGAGFRYAATEHGFIHILFSVRSDTTYCQGVPKHFDRRVRNDLYFPSFAHLGEQAVLLREIYAVGIRNDTNDDKVFGYEERFQELRNQHSWAVGIMRPQAGGSLIEWQLTRTYGSAPVLGQSFIEENPPMSNILSGGVNTGKQYFGVFTVDRVAIRPMPMFGTPATLFRM